MRLLLVLLGITAVATVAVELLNWWVTDDGGFALFVRTAWALLRSVGFLILIWHIRRGRAGAPPFALILCVTTLFALARLIIPRQGLPHPLGVAGFALIAALCAAILLLLYRSASVRDYIRRHGDPKRPRPPGWVLTARIAAFSFGPLMLVAAGVALGQVFSGRVAALPLIVVWFIASMVITYATLIVTFFLLKRKRWAETALVLLTLAVLAFNLPVTWILLGWDGLIRDAGPLVVSAILVVVAVCRHRANGRTAATDRDMAAA